MQKFEARNKTFAILHPHTELSCEIGSIREVPGPNIGAETGCPAGSSLFSSFHPAKYPERTLN
jgi:hypothetical protein